MLRLDTRYLPGFAEALPAHQEALLSARERLLAKRGEKAQMLGWLDLPEDTETLRAIRRYREENPWVEDFVLLGIGGSALGPKALEAAFNASGVRFHYVDHVEPEPVLRLLRTLDPRKTLVNAISKSGATAETLAVLLIFLNWLREALGEGWRRHLVLTTDPQRGALRALAEREGLKAFAIPEDVGGRFSVLSPVGLLPLAFAGADVEALLMGARQANANALAPLEESLPLKTALLHHLHRHLPDQRLHGLRGAAQVPSRLVRPAPRRVPGQAGPGGEAGGHHRLARPGPPGPARPAPALPGRSPGQAPGPGAPRGPHGGPPHPPWPGLEEAGYLFGKGLFRLLKAEAEATYQALAEAGQPVYALYLSEVSPYAVGWLLQLLMWQTALLGELWGVNAFDQPGVELSKRLTREILAREG